MNQHWTVQAWLVRNAVRLQKEALLFTDERSKLEGELLNGIDVVKCNSWEASLFPCPHSFHLIALFSLPTNLQASPMSAFVHVQQGQ